MIRILPILPLLLFCPIAAISQKSISLKGSVIDQSTLVVIPGATLTCMSRMTLADSTGNYTMVLKAGPGRIRVTHRGYEPMDTVINIQEGNTVIFKMRAVITDMKGASIRESRTKSNFQKLHSTETGKLEIQVSELRKVPAIGGETDLIKAIQLTPGIKRGTEGSIGMYVRGGGADQNLIMLDDAVIYNAGHLLGFFSIFNSNAVRDMAVYKSGFPAMYGGRLSSVLDIRTREGSMKKSSIEGSLGTISSSLTVQGPVQKNKSSFIVSARRSYIDRAFKLVGKELPMYFQDINAGLLFRLGKHDCMSFSTYYGRDVLNWDGKIKVKDTAGKLSLLNNLNVVSNSDLGNFTNTLRWNHRPSGGRLSYQAALIYSNFNYRVEGKFAGNEIFVQSSIRDLGAKTDFNLNSALLGKLRFGLNSVYRIFRPNLISSTGSISDVRKSQNAVRKNNLENSAYFQSERQITKDLSVNCGARLSSLRPDDGKVFWGIEPRASLRYMLDSSNSIKFSYTRMKQYIHLVSSSSLALPTDLWYPVTKNAVPEISDQLSIGYYTDFHKKALYFSTELYYKDLKNIIEFREGSSLIFNDNVEKDMLRGHGKAYGAEVFLNVKTGKFSGWAGYTLSWSTRQFDSLNNGQPFFSKYDRRHDISLVGNYKLSRKWSLSASWILATGNPFTAKIGQYIAITPGQNDVVTLPVYSSRNSHRFATSHRLDLDVCYKIGTGKKFDAEIHFSVYNMYNRTQPSRVDIVKEDNGNYKFQQKGLFGLIPAISCNFKI